MAPSSDEHKGIREPSNRAGEARVPAVVVRGSQGRRLVGAEDGARVPPTQDIANREVDRLVSLVTVAG